MYIFESKICYTNVSPQHGHLKIYTQLDRSRIHVANFTRYD